MNRFRFHKSQRLKNSKSISGLFESGIHLYKYPLKVMYRIHTGDSPGVKAGFTVPGRNFRNAVDRNRLKRRMRESFRLNQPDLEEFLNSGPVGLNLFFIYTSTREEDYPVIDRALRFLIASLQERIK